VDWARLTAEAQERDRDSMLWLYRNALHLRREYFAHPSALEWIDSPDGTLAFRRGQVQCWVNMSSGDIDLPQGEVLLMSAPAPSREGLPSDSSAWVLR
jgi:alpha-glucosidase